MEEIIELLTNYGPMTASELALELGRDLGQVERELSLSSFVLRNGPTYLPLEK